MGKKYFVIAVFITIVLVVLVILAGCGGGEETSTTVATEETTTSTILLEEQLIQKLIEDEAADTNEYPNTIENQILTKYLASWARDDGRINIVNPRTTTCNIDIDNTFTMSYLSEWSSDIKDCDILALVDKFNELNKDSIPLTCKSSINNGYCINHDDKVWKYMAELGEGYYLGNRTIVLNVDFDSARFQDELEVSMPAYDEETGYVLIYSYWSDRAAIIGTLNLLKYEDGNLQELYSETIISGSVNWISTTIP